jgi:hypothetical protein
VLLRTVGGKERTFVKQPTSGQASINRDFVRET